MIGVIAVQRLCIIRKRKLQKKIPPIDSIKCARTGEVRKVTWGVRAADERKN